MVAMDLGVEYVPEHLLCKTHPCLKFNRKTWDVFRDMENALEPEKMYSSFLTNATTNHGTVFEQYIDCIR